MNTRIMRRKILLILVFAGLTLSALGILALHPHQKVLAQSSCSVAMLSGNYGGYSFDYCSGGTKCNNVLWYHFDGAGNYEAVDDYMSGGTFGTVSGFGTYSASTLANGQCQLTFFPSSGPSTPAAPVNGGSEVYILNTISGYNLSTILKKQ